MTDGTRPGRYLWDNTLEEEKARLDAQAAIWDPYTIRYLEGVGVGAGWRCLELGAGSGTITAWLARRIAPSGRVVAGDIDPRFLGWIDDPLVDIRQVDVTADDMEKDAYNLVYARFLLMHLPNATSHLEKMVGAVKPGGWILVQDVDLSFNETSAAKHWTWPPSNHRFLLKIQRALNGLLRATRAETDFARDMPRRLIGLGLEAVGAESVTRLVWGARDGPYAVAFERVVPYLIEYGGLSERDADKRNRQLRDPAYAFTSAPVMSAWGRKPGSPEPAPLG